MTRVRVLATWMEYRPAARVVDLPSAVNDLRIPVHRRADYARIQRRITGHVAQRGALASGLQMVS